MGSTIKHNASLPAAPPDHGESTARTLSEHLFHQIAEAIIRGDITAGSKISEPVLARQFGVSRGPLREALHRLQERRLVTRIPHMGPRVTNVSYQLLQELFIVREALEGMAAREAARNGSAQEIRAIRDVHELYLSSFDRETEPPPYIPGTADTDFHFLIAQASHNPTLINLLCSDLHLLLRFYRTRMRDLVGRAPRVLVEHQRILEAIEERDPDMSELLMRRHIAAARTALSALFSPTPGQVKKH